MAYTKIWQVKTTLSSALAYIENPEKTEEKILVSGYNVDPEIASVEMEMTRCMADNARPKYGRKDAASILAHHMLQSFDPRENITPAEAHELGKKLADELLQGKYEYVISTHIDKGHIHNHIIFNATSFYDFSKFECKPYKTAKEIRTLSDKICRENGLSVIVQKSGRKGMNHYEWDHRKNGSSWKEKIEQIIDETIAVCDDYTDFRKRLREAGVEIGGTKYIKFRIVSMGQERFTRGNGDYTRERIQERILNHDLGRVLPAKNERLTIPEKMSDPFDKRVAWAAQKLGIAQTKDLAETINTILRENIQTVADFNIRTADAKAEMSALKGKAGEIQVRVNQYQDVVKCLLMVKKLQPVLDEATELTGRRAKQYKETHAVDLAAVYHALDQLDRYGVSPAVDPDKVMELVYTQHMQRDLIDKGADSQQDRVNRLQKAKGITMDVLKGKTPEQGKDQKTQNR